ncbi:hypothetical protein BDF22DRAFT_323191 [Syncephalis plumigaleata]|nr:hypothetical protein BDF22DRAFT_323191 [Syncephalis plumigaleata]
MPLFIIPWFSSGIGNDGRHYFSPFMSGEWQNINQDGWSMTGHPPAATKAMQALPVRLPPNYANNKASPHNDDPTITNNEESIEDCAVCQDPLFASNTVSTEDTKEGDAKEATTVREMPCGHAFHEACLFPWLRRSNTCPCCRWELDTDNVDYNRVIHRRRSERLAQMGKLPCKLVEYQYCNHCDTTTINNNSENTSKTLEEPVAVPKESNDIRTV